MILSTIRTEGAGSCGVGRSDGRPGKKDWKDPKRFKESELIIRHLPWSARRTAVCSNSLLNAFQVAKAKSLSMLIVDDEADQASLNTNTGKPAD